MSNHPIEKHMLELVQRGRITPEIALSLRRSMYADGEISSTEADQLFYLDRNCGDVCAEWVAFFVEALTDYLVFQVKPRGYVSQENARWLIDHIDGGGGAKTQTGLELLIEICETALTVPAQLASHVIGQVTNAVLSGSGPTRNNQMLTPGAIGAAEVALLRRVLYAAGGEDHNAISHAEANALFNLNDATADAENDPAWSDLFVKAIASYLMACQGYVAPSREDALNREDWVEENSPTFGGMAGEMVANGFSSLLVDGLRTLWSDMQTASGVEAAYAEKMAAQEGEIAQAERITEKEAEWVISRIGRGGTLHDNEIALLRFIRAESPDIHPALKPLLELVA